MLRETDKDRGKKTRAQDKDPEPETPDRMLTALFSWRSCRFHTMAIMFAVNVLGCTGTNEERAVLLYKIIQIAAELKSTMGNMFGFAAVMKALELPQVNGLNICCRFHLY